MNRLLLCLLLDVAGRAIKWARFSDHFSGLVYPCPTPMQGKKFLRKVHLYIGIFATPALLFLAITGPMQTFSLHETTRAATIRLRRGLQLWRNCTRGRRRSCRRERRGRLTPAGSNGAEHKADGLAGSAGQAAPAKAAGYLRSEPATPVAPETSHLPMKIFFLLASVSLLISTLTGI
jgi:uncharacterized iron-regulated membrane protein